MNTHSVPIASLALDPANARKHSDKNLAAIKGSLARFGQQKPIVVGKNGVVIAGNGTLEAAKSLGWDTIDVVHTELDGPDAIAFALADNRTAELAEWDDEILGRSLHSLREIDFDLTAIGFDTSYLDTIHGPGDQQAGDVDHEAEWEGMPPFEDDGPCFRKIVMNFDSAEDVAAFFQTIGQAFTDKTKSAWFPKKERRDLESSRWVADDATAEE